MLQRNISKELIAEAKIFFKEILSGIPRNQQKYISVIIVGSTSISYGDKHSDVDGKIICWKPIQLKKQTKTKNSHRLDFEITTIDEFCINSLIKENDWSKTSPFGLFAVSKAVIVHDPEHRFRKIQKKVNKYYPDKVWKNLISGAWRGLLEDGQYNLRRDIRRKKEYMAYLHSSNAIWHSILLCFYINRRYYPTHHQWLYDEFENLPILSKSIETHINRMIRTTNATEKQKNIQKIIDIYSKYLKRKHLILDAHLEKWWLIPWR